MIIPRDLTMHLKAILGEDGLAILAQALGGTRVYVSWNMRDDNEVVQALGRDQADKLSRALAPATIRVPLARKERAIYYRRQGLSDAKIARKLGITENAVAKLFKRQQDLPERPKKAKSPAQIEMF